MRRIKNKNAVSFYIISLFGQNPLLKLGYLELELFHSISTLFVNF